MTSLSKYKKHFPFILFLSISALFMLFSIIWVYHAKVLNAPKVYSDGFGYFLYLPAFFIYHDFSFSFIEGWEHPFDLIQAAGGLVNKYAVGTAVMESPFFLAAHLLSLLKDAVTGSHTATGYTNLYQYFILFGGIFYWMVGTTFLYKLLTKYGAFSEKVSLMTCFFITYGTNLFHYASYDACFSHIYSYTLFILFLYYLCWYESPARQGKNKLIHTCIFGFLAGLIFMVRNTNILFVLTYVFYGVHNLNTLKLRFVTILKPKRAFPIIITGFITLLPQLCYWHTATGHWFIYSYGSNEPFYWLAPQTINWLFSVRKGLFFWSPILIVAVIGMFCSYKRHHPLYTGTVIFLIIITYISSAWWSWWYGGSFGQRVAVDFLCVFALFMAYTFSLVETGRITGSRTGHIRICRIMLYGYCTLCTIWNLICMLGYWYRIIPSDGATWQDISNLITHFRMLF